MTGVSLCVGTMERPDSDSMSGGDRQTRVLSLDSEARHGILGMLKIVSPRSNGENGMRRFTITDIVEATASPPPPLPITPPFQVLKVPFPGIETLLGFRAPTARAASTSIRLDTGNLGRTEAF